jgi:hypothetical protein
MYCKRMAVRLKFVSRPTNVFDDFKNIKSYAISSHGSYPADLGVSVDPFFEVPSNVYIAFAVAPSEICISNIDKYIYKYFRTPKFMVAAIANPDIEEAKLISKENIYIPELDRHYLQTKYTKSSAFVRAARSFYFCMPGQKSLNMLLDFTDNSSFKSRLFDLQSNKKDRSSVVSNRIDSVYNNTMLYLKEYVYNLAYQHELVYGPGKPFVVYVVACGSDQYLAENTRQQLIKTLYNNNNIFKSHLSEFHDITIPTGYFKEKSDDMFMYNDIQEVIETVIAMEEEPYVSRLKIMYDAAKGAPYIIVYNGDGVEMYRADITIRHYHVDRRYVKINVFPVVIPDDILADVVTYLYELFYNSMNMGFDFYFVFKDDATDTGQSISIENGVYIDSRKQSQTEQQMLRTRVDKPSSMNENMIGGGGSNRIRLHNRRFFTVKRRR